MIAPPRIIFKQPISPVATSMARLGLRRRGFAATSSSSTNKTSGGRPHLRKALLGAAAVGIPLIGISEYVRQWRKRELQKLPKASFTLTTPDNDDGGYLWFPIEDLLLNLTRTGLMGHMMKGAHSVKQELDLIRKWHMERDFKGGLVLRDLEQPLFGQVDAEEMLEDPMRLARRECYYLYYEMLPSSEIRQQIFCRGTTLKVDVLTCLQFLYVYDEELDARLHFGFLNHAERLIEDILPLLVNDKRATIEIFGHSLGGAVAAIVALKLKKRGYNVTRLTMAASPRFCDNSSALKLSSFIPRETLRIEDDRDLIPFLPPFGRHLQCDKLWLVQDEAPRFIRKENLPAWVDSVWTNFRAWEVLSSCATKHRMYSHVAQLQKIKEPTRSSEAETPEVDLVKG